jgi:hypothetical protein
VYYVRWPKTRRCPLHSFCLGASYRAAPSKGVESRFRSIESRVFAQGRVSGFASLEMLLLDEVPSAVFGSRTRSCMSIFFIRTLLALSASVWSLVVSVANADSFVLTEVTLG